MIELDRLAAALALSDHELVSIVGGGGKSTTMFALGRQLVGRRVLTTTTKLGGEQTGDVPLLDTSRADESNDLAADLRDALDSSGVVLAVSRSTLPDKLGGVRPERCDRWFDLADYVIVEADGARGHPFTAPNVFEPVIPSRTTTLLSCIGASALGKVIADRCHRPLRVAAAAECSPYERLSPERAARALLSSRGSRKNCPPAARHVVIICQVAVTSAPLANELAEVLSDRAECLVVKAAARVGSHRVSRGRRGDVASPG